LKDHDRLEDELASLARREKIKLPKEMNEEHEDYVEDVAKADREDFDKEFLTALKKINEETNERFMAMATDAKDADVRAFSARKLDLLKAHAQKMERVEQDLLNTY
jgi:putative membrane protein